MVEERRGTESQDSKAYWKEEHALIKVKPHAGHTVEAKYLEASEYV